MCVGGRVQPEGISLSAYLIVSNNVRLIAQKMLKEENGLMVEMEELVSVKKIDVEYRRNISRGL